MTPFLTGADFGLSQAVPLIGLKTNTLTMKLVLWSYEIMLEFGTLRIANGLSHIAKAMEAR